jgi:hypothetical protein
VKYIRSFVKFWWDFIVGDDWRLAASVVAGLALTYFLAHRDITAWYVMPLVVAVALAWSLRRATR